MVSWIVFIFRSWLILISFYVLSLSLSLSFSLSLSHRTKKIELLQTEEHLSEILSRKFVPSKCFLKFCFINFWQFHVSTVPPTESCYTEFSIICAYSFIVDQDAALACSGTLVPTSVLFKRVIRHVDVRFPGYTASAPGDASVPQMSIRRGFCERH